MPDQKRQDHKAFCTTYLSQIPQALLKILLFLCLWSDETYYAIELAYFRGGNYEIVASA